MPPTEICGCGRTLPQFKPTLWHRLGFGHRSIAPWDDDGHYMVSTVLIDVDWRDLLRLLVARRLQVEVRSRFDRPVLDPVESRSAIGVVPRSWP